jgi:hypothetical protein
MKEVPPLSGFLPKPHPAKEIFRRNSIPISAVANFLGLSTNYTCQLLTGFSRLTAENAQKLKKFVALVKCEAKGKE